MAQVTADHAAHEDQPVVDTERSRFAATIVIGHAVKHTLTASLQGALLPEIKIGLGLSATQVGSLGTVQQITGWAATMGSGYLGDRFYRHTGTMLAISLGMTGSALLVAGMAPNYFVLLMAMLFMGFGPSMFHPPAIGALSRRFADRRSFAISLHGTGGSIGETLGPLVGAGLLSILYWRDVLRIEFIPAMLTAFLLWRLLRDRSAPEDHGHNPAGTLTEYFSSFVSLLKQKTLLLIFMVTALRGVGQASTSIFLPIYLREDLGYSAALVGVYIALSQVTGIASQPVMGLLADRFGHKAVILPALALFAGLLLVVPLADGKIAVAAVMLGLGFFSFSMQSILTSAAVEQAGETMHSTVTSMIFASTFVGSLSPTVAGILADAYGLQVTFIMGGLLVASAAVTMALTRLPKRVATS